MRFLVRRSSALPAASFRFHLAMDTLAVRLTVPLIGPAKLSHLLGLRPAGRTKRKRALMVPSTPVFRQATFFKSYYFFPRRRRAAPPRSMRPEPRRNIELGSGT